MTIEQKYTEIVDRMKADMHQACLQAMDSIHGEMMPHIDCDTFMNAQSCAERGIQDILAGRFSRQGNHIVTPSLMIRVKMTDHEYDGLRKSILEVMPDCPKDLEIKSLREQLRRSYEYDRLY